MSLPLEGFINTGKWSRDSVHKISFDNSHNEWLIHSNDIEPKLEDAYNYLSKFDKTNPNYKTAKDWVEKLEELREKINPTTKVGLE
jgi:hypothetical protein